MDRTQTENSFAQQEKKQTTVQFTVQCHMLEALHLSQRDAGLTKMMLTTVAQTDLICQ
jgi:hypothetical protein